MSNQEESLRELNREQIQLRNELAHSIGEFMKYWGFKTIHGRVWVHIFLSSAPVTATQLVSELTVTKSLVSMILSELLEYGVIEKVDIGSLKSPGYQSVEDLQTAVLKVLKMRESVMLKEIGEKLELCHEAFKNDRVQSIKIKHLLKMNEFALDCLSKVFRMKPISTTKFRSLFKMVLWNRAPLG